MKAILVRQFGGTEALVCEDVEQPDPGAGEVLLRVEAAGVGPWDAWVRSGTSAVAQTLPLIPGADLSGVVERAGPGATFQPGEAVYGVTNAQFTGAYAEYAVAAASMIARKPARLGFVEAASMPVVASTAWQMLFDHGGLNSTMRVLVLGGAGNVGAFAVQLAKRVAREVIATALGADVEYTRTLGADRVIDVRAARTESEVSDIDLVIDTVGGEALAGSFAVVKRGGVVVSSVALPDQGEAARQGVRGVFFLVAVTSEGLARISNLIDEGQLTTQVGEVLPLSSARIAHEMLAGRPHKRGKIVLTANTQM
jgi:NADPH:quinone reductase-like Zn-dependent oxidoreductase